MVEFDRQQLIEYLEATLKAPIRPKRIKAITVNPSSHDLPKMRIEVGSYQANLESERSAELVIGIFETTLFVVCTPERGGLQGLPYFFARQDVRRVELDD
jgi:hypothetical protein